MGTLDLMRGVCDDGLFLASTTGEASMNESTSAPAETPTDGTTTSGGFLESATAVAAGGSEDANKSALSVAGTCTGAGDVPSGLPLCYTAELLGETLGVKVLSYYDGVGSCSLASKGPLQLGGCDE